MSNLEKWRILNSIWVVYNQWCKVRQDKVELPNGVIVEDYFVNVRPEIALILAITPQQDIVFVNQYRHGVAEILLELPAGTFEATQETALSAGKRELEEETGYISEQWVSLGMIYDNPVKDNNKIHLFLALDAEPMGKQALDITEAVEIVLIPVKEVKSRILSGEICVAGTLAAIFLGLERLSQYSNQE